MTEVAQRPKRLRKPIEYTYGSLLKQERLATGLTVQSMVKYGNRPTGVHQTQQNLSLMENSPLISTRRADTYRDILWRAVEGEAKMHRQALARLEAVIESQQDQP